MNTVSSVTLTSFVSTCLFHTLVPRSHLMLHQSPDTWQERVLQAFWISTRWCERWNIFCRFELSMYVLSKEFIVKPWPMRELLIGYARYQREPCSAATPTFCLILDCFESRQDCCGLWMDRVLKLQCMKIYDSSGNLVGFRRCYEREIKNHTTNVSNELQTVNLATDQDSCRQKRVKFVQSLGRVCCRQGLGQYYCNILQFFRLAILHIAWVL
jgi:hypothetical protein